MSWTIQPFQNTDLHNIYEAIVSGGGGGDTLAGQLLNGSATPQFPNNFYPQAIRGIYELFDGQVNPSNVTQGYPSIMFALVNALNDIDGLFNGATDPTNLFGFYPTNILQQSASLANIEGYTGDVDRFLDGSKSPSDFTGFYPDTLFKIKENTSATEANVKALFKFGNAGGGGRTILARGVDGFADSATAATAAATWMNSQGAQYACINITISHIAGVNGHSYAVLYYQL